MTKENLLQHLQECCDRMFGCSLEMATEKQVYRAVCVAVRELLEDERRAFVEQTRAQENKQVYYMSMEFLVGTSLRNNLYNMGLLEPAGEILHDLGFSLESLCALEPDAGLGNGGLGRLASCYMDAATGLNYPVTGFSIRYEFGIFRQKIVDGWQMEFPDNWLEMGDVWLHTRKDDAVEVRFGGQVHEWMDGDKFKTAQTGYQSVIAVPHDLYISGYGSKAVNKLTLWSASMPQSFDMNAFSRGDYVRALEQNTMAEAISKVLYPADDHINGKRLRLRQQYLLVSSSLQSILNEHLKNYHTLDNLADKVAVHINDTHPALCVPELMRLLVDEHDYGWERAWEITCATLSYTNHTVMAEALERWPVDLFREQLPRIYAICLEINRRLMEKLHCVYPNDPGKWEYMAAVTNSEVRMANLCLACCHKINGVSQLHTDILEKTIFRDYYNLDHSRFLNITNGIAYRRWLCQSNPALTGYLQSLIGDGFLKDANALEALEQYRGKDGTFDLGLDELSAVTKLLGAFGVPEENFAVDLTIARGLDYYTGTVYETTLLDHPEIGSVCSGGRYDNLAEYYTDRPLPGVGISIGLTRLFYVLNEQGMLNDARVMAPADVMIVPMTDDLEPSVRLATGLRERGIRVQLYAEQKKFKAKIQYADKLHIPYVVFLGEDEIAQGKDLRSGEQITVPAADAAERILADIELRGQGTILK